MTFFNKYCFAADAEAVAEYNAKLKIRHYYRIVVNGPIDPFL